MCFGRVFAYTISVVDSKYYNSFEECSGAWMWLMWFGRVFAYTISVMLLLILCITIDL